MPNIVERNFSRSDLDRIEAAVVAAERTTDGEIAVVIAPRSRSWLADPWLWAALGAIVVVGIVLLRTQSRSWDSSVDAVMSMTAGFAVFVLTVVLGYPGMLASARRRSVWKSAMHAFGGLKPTRAKTGVLIYISLDEKNAAVIADKGIAEKVPDDYWLGPYQSICGAFGEGKPTDGVLDAITAIGTELTRYFPRSDGDSNELPNRPIVTQ